MFNRIKTLTNCLLAAALLAFSSASSAALITYIYSGTSTSGTLDGQAFTNLDITITAIADTNNIGGWCCSDGQNTHFSTTINIDGIGSADILTASHSWYADGTVGFGEDQSSNWMTMSDAALLGYDLSTSIGPVFGTFLDVTQFNNVSTSLGLLSFTDSRIGGTFQAITSDIPEPLSFALFGTGLFALGSLRRKKA